VISTQTNDNDGIRFRSAVTNSRGSVVNADAIAKTGFWVKAIKSGSIDTQWAPSNGMYKFVKATDGTYQVESSDDDTQFDVRWPVDNSLDFYATNLDPQNNTLVGPTVDVNPKYNSFKPASAIKDQIDFVYASNKGNRIAFPNSIPLKFKHALAQIEVQAKCGATNYEVKVKGYRLAYVSESGTFTYGDVQMIGSPTYKDTENVEPNAGSWSELSSNYVNYSSEFWGGDGYTTGAYDGYFDKDDNHYYKLGTTATPILGSGNEGYAMVVPQTVSNYDPNTKKGAYLALLVQINKIDASGNITEAVYPSANKSNPDKRIAYDGLPKCYGYVATPVIFNWEAGKKYTYILDLTDAAGYVDPEKPSVVDPDDPSKPGNEDDDKYDKEDEVFGHAIKFTVTVSDWDITPGNKTIDM
jgi:hypothetical protein